MIDNVEKINKILLTVLVIFVLVIIILPTKVFAQTCTSDGAYGQTCVYNKTFELEKKVRIQGDNSWKDKVVDVEEGDVIEFRIKIKNIGEIEVDDMKMTDFLPDELLKTGGSGLTEYWDDFEVDETKTFIIEARIRSNEFERDDNFEKCVVNKAKVEYDGTLEGSDTAIVCYGNEEITELPETGATATSLLAILGFVSTGLGLSLKKRSE